MSVTAIIQARTGSARLPNKVLLDLEGRTMLERVVERASLAKSIDNVVVATTVDMSDLQIVALMSGNGIRIYCGSEIDVLDRYYQAAKLCHAQHVVRITADCPVIDPQVIDRVVGRYFESEADYCSNTLVETYPDGQDVEVFSYSVLQAAWTEAVLPSEREHVTPFIKKNSGRFRLISCEHEPDLSHLRWTIDEPRDYEVIQIFYRELNSKNATFGMAEILEYLDKRPSIQAINQGIKRNEGYAKSLLSDKQSIHP
ncbi:cytidylyltransferase domain-containing protein [Planctomycetota bacterium]